MTEEKPRHPPRDHNRIALDDDEDVGYWTGELGVTEAELRHAVHTAGVLIDDVRAHLRKQRG
jgi:hypothetical protein